MKRSIFMATLTLLASALSLVLAESSTNKVNKVHSEIMSYVYQNMGQLRMMRGNPSSLVCYNEFIPLINSLANKARDISKVCVSNANEKKDQELKTLKNHRSEIALEVAKITKYLADCSEQRGLDYFNCLAENADNNMKTMETIKNKSGEILSQYGTKTAEIDRDEKTCLNNAVDCAKSETDKAFDDLKLCLIN